MPPRTIPKSIIIVGGGTAGWMTAAFLWKAWSRGVDSSITVIESPQVERVGVGESSIPSMLRLLSHLGIDEADWMNHCQATFKSTLHLVGWSGLPGCEEYYHPLFCWGEDHLSLFADWFQARHEEAFTEPLDFCYQGVHLARQFRGARKLTAPPFSSPVQYAYHLDAALFAEYLKAWSCKRGVTSIVDHVAGVCLGSDGTISHLKTNASGDLSAEWFFDCTGFRGLLINQTLEEPFIPYADALFCDSAIAVSTFTDAPEEALPCETLATALSTGWCWDIPLQHRHGTGYVYSSAHLSRDEAERELRAYLGTKVKQSDARHIKMRVGRTRRAWVKNCVSVGLSTGFIEPLESTSIFCIQYGIAQLLLCLQQCETDFEQRETYNTRMRLIFEGIRDFIVLHYHLNQRTDTDFWKENRNHSHVPDALRDILERWRRGEDIEPTLKAHASAPLVNPASWYCILAGLRCLPGAPAQEQGAERSRASVQLTERIQCLAANARDYPSHAAYLATLD